MNKDLYLKGILPKTVCMTPEGFIADELSVDEFQKIHKEFFKVIFEVSKANIDGIYGYGLIMDDLKTKYNTCKEYLEDNFRDDRDDYWYHWKEMFDTTVLKEEFFYKYYNKMMEKLEFCEGQRYLINNNTWFSYMITDGKTLTGLPDWSNASIGDFLIDFAIMDLNKPYLKIPELLARYCLEEGIQIPNFKERFLCMAYFKGIDCLRWHASIDDLESCTSIVKSIGELEERINAIEDL